MHMADALISPTVGVTMWTGTAGMLGYSAWRAKKTPASHRVPMMGILSAFVFAAQMINFSIPGTGSSGHIVGGILLAAFLGSDAAFLGIASVLVIQALFFADGGLLALGANIFNMGFLPCYVAYPLIYKPIAGDGKSSKRIAAGAVTASIVGLQMGAFSVVMETMLSGISELPFTNFLMLMLPIHLAIGLVEGLATSAILLFVREARPDLLSPEAVQSDASSQRVGFRTVWGAIAVATFFVGGFLSWFASSHPDGLEWAMGHVSGREELAGPNDGIHATARAVQNKAAIMPDYAFRESDAATAEAPASSENIATSTAGILGGVMTLLISGIIALLLWKRNASDAPAGDPDTTQ